MARPKRYVPNVKLTEFVEKDPAAVARALETWAILLADHAQRVAMRRHVQDARQDDE